MGQVAGVGQGEPFGQGVEAAAELDPAQQRLEFVRDDWGRGGHRGTARRWPGGGRRLGVRGEVGRVAGEPAGDHRRGRCGGRPGRPGPVAFSVARSSIRPISATLNASASSARAQAALTRSGPPLLTRPSRA